MRHEPLLHRPQTSGKNEYSPASTSSRFPQDRKAVRPRCSFHQCLSSLLPVLAKMNVVKGHYSAHLPCVLMHRYFNPQKFPCINTNYNNYVLVSSSTYLIS